jgi:hypothetical protein
LNSVAQTKLIFKYDCSSYVEIRRITVYLNYANNKIELLNDTIREFENILSVPPEETDYILSVEFEFKSKSENGRGRKKSLEFFSKESLEYPFTLAGDETDVEINVDFSRSDWKKKEGGSIEVIKYYKSNLNLLIKYLPEMKGDEYYKAPFFLFKNNSNDTIYGQYHPNYFWGSISFLIDSEWSSEYFGRLDYNFAGGSPLFPDSVTLAWVGSFGWRNELLKNRYKYTLIYTTDKKDVIGVKQYLEKDNFIWWADTKKYYRLIYEFDVK